MKNYASGHNVTSYQNNTPPPFHNMLLGSEFCKVKDCWTFHLEKANFCVTEMKSPRRLLP